MPEPHEAGAPRRLAFGLARLATARPEAIDGMMGIALGGAALAQVAPELRGGTASTVTVLAIVALSGALVWRRRHPLVLVLLAVVISFVQAALAAHIAMPEMALLEYLLIAYSVGAHTRPRLALPSVFALVAALEAYQLIDSASGKFSPVFPLVVCLPPWFAGRVLRSRRELSVELADRAGELEVEREQLAELAVRAERARIARELHDVVAHCVSLIVIQAAGGGRIVEADAEMAEGAFGAIIHAGDQALEELERMVSLLDDLSRDAAEPGLDRLGELVQRAEESGMRVTLSVEGATALPRALDKAAFRIVQEAITNAVKHAGPGALSVSARRGEQRLELEIIDDGPTSQKLTAVAGGGHGLSGMRERIELLGGTLEAGPDPTGGWALRASLPLARDEQPRVPVSDAAPA